MTTYCCSTLSKRECEDVYNIISGKWDEGEFTVYLFPDTGYSMEIACIKEQGEAPYSIGKLYKYNELVFTSQREPAAKFFGEWVLTEETPDFFLATFIGEIIPNM